MIKPLTIITGSTRGIGKQIGLDLIKKGHYVVFTGTNLDALTSLIKEVGKKNASVMLCDFTSKEEITSFCDNFKDKKIDNIIFNVGETNRESFVNLTRCEWDNVFDTNLNKPVFIIQQLCKQIQKRIIFIGSVSGHVPDATSIPYGVSKGALEILTKYLAKEFASRKITVNTLAPGYTSTNWHVNKSKAQIKRIEKKILLKRFATVEEISHACQFLIENDYITGQTLCVDGGFNYE